MSSYTDEKLKSGKASIDSPGTASIFLDKKAVLLGHFGTPTQSHVTTKGGMNELVGKSSLTSTPSPTGCGESVTFHSFSGPAGSHPQPLGLGPFFVGSQEGVVLLCSPGLRGASLPQRGWLRSWVSAPSPGRLDHAGSPVNQVQPAQQPVFYFLN